MYNYYLNRYGRGKNKKEARKRRNPLKASDQEIQEVLERNNKCQLCGRPVLLSEKAPAPMGAMIEKDSEGNIYPIHCLCYREREKGRPPVNITKKRATPGIYPVDLPHTIDWKEYRAK